MKFLDSLNIDQPTVFLMAIGFVVAIIVLLLALWPKKNRRSYGHSDFGPSLVGKDVGLAMTLRETNRELNIMHSKAKTRRKESKRGRIRTLQQ